MKVIIRQEHFTAQRLSSAPRLSKFSSPSSLPSETTTPLFLMYSVPSPERDACQVAATTCEVNDTSRLLGLSPYHIKQRQQRTRCDVLQLVKRRPGSGRRHHTSLLWVHLIERPMATVDIFHRGWLKSTWTEQVRSRGNAYDLYSENARFEPRPGYRLTVRGLMVLFSPSKCLNITSIRPREIPSKSSPMHHQSYAI
jgi:hypothetical protein